ncbi:MAG: hypothetical protein GY696_05290, partial [Gammaproteobacteria bacterium]|nr:hypothetical protein [Gammaproteobacteria bacterium]
MSPFANGFSHLCYYNLTNFPQVLLNLLDDGSFIDGMKQMNSPDVEFLSGLELESMWQKEELNNNDKAIVEKVVETLLPLENMDLVLTLLRVANPELLRNNGMKGAMLFNSTLFDRSTVVMIFDCFKNLLEMAVETPHKVVWDLPMLTQAEQQKQLV